MAITVPEPPGPSSRSANMRANRRRDTKLEVRVRSLLHRRGLRYRVDYPIRLKDRRPVRPDIVFPALKICCELDGCFWHGCEQCSPRRPGKNSSYWGPKIARNKERDAEQSAALAAAGWDVMRFWGHEAATDIADAIEQAVVSARASRALATAA